MAELQDETSHEVLVPVPTVEEVPENSQGKGQKTKGNHCRKVMQFKKCSERDMEDEHCFIKDSFDEWCEKPEIRIPTEDPKVGAWILMKFPTKKTVKY